MRHRAPTVTGVVVERQMLPASQLYRGPGIPIFDFEHPYRTLKQILRFVRAPRSPKSGGRCSRGPYPGYLDSSASCKTQYASR